MPSSPFVVYGVIYNSSGNNTSKSQITFSTDVNSKITISDSKGRYLIDLADIEYSDGGTIYYVAYDEFRNETNSGSFTVSGGMKELNISLSVRKDRETVYGNRDTQIFGIGGKLISLANPFPVKSVELPDNYESEWVTTRGDGQPDSETITKGSDVYKRTFEYTGNILTKRSKWVKQ